MLLPVAIMQAEFLLIVSPLPHGRLAELLQSKQTEVAQETASSLHALVAGGGKKKSKVGRQQDLIHRRGTFGRGWTSRRQPSAG